MTVALDHTIVPATDKLASEPSGINHHCRGVCFDDPDNHLMEVITRTYGAKPEGRPRD